MQSAVRDEDVASLEIARPLEAEMLKYKIREMAVEGYPHSLRTSIVLWELCKEQYAEWLPIMINLLLMSAKDTENTERSHKQKQ